MASILPLTGNDVVDRADPRCAGKASDARFLARVFHPEERASILESLDPDLTLWGLWAAKETGYKIFSKLVGDPPPFRHSAFIVQMDRGAPDRRILGHLRYQDLTFEIRGEVSEDSIHVWGRHSGDSAQVHRRVRAVVEAPGWPPDPGTLSPFSDRELPAIHSHSAAAVRLFAKRDIAKALDVPPEKVEIICEGGAVGRTPPRVLVDGMRGVVDVSLSHHGRFVAWAFSQVASPQETSVDPMAGT